MSHSNPPIELELQLQYKGELASAITRIKPEGRDARTPLLMGIFDSHLNVLTLNQVEPRGKEIVWGSGQMRARWVLKRGSVSVVLLFIGSAWFKETGKPVRHVFAKASPSETDSYSQSAPRRRVRTKRSYSTYRTNQVSESLADQVPVAATEHPQSTGQQTSVAATDPRIMSTQQLAAKLSALNVRANTNPTPMTTNTLKRKRTGDSPTSPSSKRPHLSPTCPSPLTIPSFTLSVRRPSLLNDPHPTHALTPSDTLPSLSFHQHRIDLSGVRTTLLRSVQKQLGRTRAQLGETGAQLVMMSSELARERELREQLQRERENDTARRLEVTAAVTLPPSSPASVLPVPPLGSKDRPLTLEELEQEIYASDSDVEEEGEVEELPSSVVHSDADTGQRKVQEFTVMADEIRRKPFPFLFIRAPT
ncbi:hypothetical protein BC629DRAFT_1571706, partial [Irpex lacteus]